MIEKMFWEWNYNRQTKIFVSRATRVHRAKKDRSPKMIRKKSFPQVPRSIDNQKSGCCRWKIASRPQGWVHRWWGLLGPTLVGRQLAEDAAVVMGIACSPLPHPSTIIVNRLYHLIVYHS